jgi:hypothetical protein
MVIGVLTAVILLTIITFGLQSKGKQAGDNIVWLGKGVNWDYQIKLIHKPNDQVQFISHGIAGIKPCVAPDYAVEISEGLIYKGHNGGKFTSFKAVYEGSPTFLNPVNEMSYGSPQGLDDGKPYGTEHSDCFTKSQWVRMQEDTSNTVKVTVTAYPYNKSAETITLKTVHSYCCYPKMDSPFLFM